MREKIQEVQKRAIRAWKTAQEREIIPVLEGTDQYHSDIVNIVFLGIKVFYISEPALPSLTFLLFTARPDELDET